ncbi:acyltransferase family protein [Priestia megaterium]|uniref:acyltransferase family protein n=1 Tax=Priestia megaterium TaxID=1404 RepID=UPI00366C85EB
MNQTKQRSMLLDMIKGIAIILVVVGHSGNPDINKYFYWFHMPIFFLISGYLFKSSNDLSSFKDWLRKTVSKLLIPYVTFLIIITSIRYLYLIGSSNTNISQITKDVALTIFGGTFFPSQYYVVMWFITCMIFTQVIFALLITLIKNRIAVGAIVFVLYLVAHIESTINMTNKLYIPWAADVALISIFYFAIGYFVKTHVDYIKTLPVKLFAVIAFLLSVILVVADRYQYISYNLDLRGRIYNHIFLDFLIPVIFTTSILLIGSISVNIPILRTILSEFGKTSLIIMYLHIPIKLIIENFYHNNSVTVLLGLLIPYVLSKLFLERVPLMRFLFLGVQSFSIYKRNKVA